jgi:hypothetical protein
LCKVLAALGVVVPFLVVLSQPAGALPLPNPALQTMVFSPNGSTAYVADSDAIDVVSLGAGGPVNTQQIFVGTNITGMVINSTGTQIVAISSSFSPFLGGSVSSAAYVVNLAVNPPSVTTAYMNTVSSISSVAMAPSGAFALISVSGKLSFPIGPVGGGITETTPGTVDVLSLVTSPPRIIEAVPVGYGLGSMEIGPSGNNGYVLNNGLLTPSGSQQLTSLDLTTFPLGLQGSVAVSGSGLVLSPGGSRAYVGGQVIDLTTNPPTLLAPAAPAVTFFTADGVTPDGRFVYLASSNQNGPITVEDTSTTPPTSISFGLINANNCTNVTINPQGTLVYCGVAESDPIVPSISSIAPTSGVTAGGYNVTINGARLTGASAVTFGPNAGSIVSINPAGTSMTVTVPAGTIGTVPVSVTTAGGTNPPIPTDVFQYTPTPPVITSIVPAQGPATGNTGVLVGGTGFTGATAVNFGSTVVTTRITVNSTGTLLGVFSPPGTGVVHITVTTPLGTSAPTTADEFTYDSNPPVVTAITPSIGLGTGGTPVLIGGTGFTGATSVSFGAGHPATIVTITPNGKFLTAIAPAGTGTVDVTVTGPEGTSPIVSGDKFTYVGTKPVVLGVLPLTGSSAGGTGVLIAGVNMIGVTAVHFGPNPAQIVGGSPTGAYIGVIAPRGVGTVDVTVTNALGTSAIVPTDKFIYTGL